MKKLIVIVLLALFTATLVSSCKTQKCPAYEDKVVVNDN